MQEHQTAPAQPRNDFHQLVQLTLNIEKNRKSGAKSIYELKRYLNEFASYCENQTLSSVKDISPAFLKEYVEQRSKTGGPCLKKAVVWSLRKFCTHLTFLQFLNDNPAKNLKHPEIHPRFKLPKHLTASQLRQLLEYAWNHLELVHFAIISLLATTGLRPNEIISAKRSDVHLQKHYIEAHVKGGWIKRTPIGSSMAAVLADYLATRDDDCQALFVNTRKRPVSRVWLQLMVKAAGKAAGLDISLTCRHLRHTFATHAADRNGTIITKALLGHKRLATTRIYTHLSPRRFKSLMNLHPYPNLKK